jgi:CspA family cold shock protein
MPIGRVKWFENRKGFGFIEQETAEDIFVHFSNIAGNGFRTLNDGEQVTYDVVPGPKGLMALNVKRVDAMEQEQGA